MLWAIAFWSCMCFYYYIKPGQVVRIIFQSGTSYYWTALKQAKPDRSYRINPVLLIEPDFESGFLKNAHP